MSYKPGKAVGADAYPFTTLYWDFLDRNYTKLKDNARLEFQIVQLERKRKDPGVLLQIRKQARGLQKHFASDYGSEAMD